MARKYITVKWSIEEAEHIKAILDRTIDDLVYLTEDYSDTSDSDSEAAKNGNDDLVFYKELREKVENQTK